MHRRPALLAAALAVLTLPTHSLASAADLLTLTLEETTAVRFSLRSTLHTVHGELPLHSGWIRFDPDTGRAEGEVVLDALGAATGNASRDRKMHEEVLLSAAHPRIVFTPVRLDGFLPGGGPGQDVRLVGIVELLGRGHELTIPATILRTDGHLDGSATLTLPFVAWGVKDPSVFVMRTAKDLTVTIEIHGSLVS